MSSKLSCAECGAPMYSGKGSLPQGLAKCHSCRRAHPACANVTCRECGKGVRQGPGSLPQGEAVCRGCRVAAFAPLHMCPDCGGTKSRNAKRCADCGHKARRIRSDDDPRTTRRLREAAAPGINRRTRYRILAEWKRQGRACAYCGDTATTLDHVIPLIRGGSNYEGNLVPACAACNFSKGSKLLVEWRAAHAMGPSLSAWPKVGVLPRPAAVQPRCELCGRRVAPGRRKYCSPMCADEANRTKCRESARSKAKSFK